MAGGFIDYLSIINMIKLCRGRELTDHPIGFTFCSGLILKGMESHVRR
jgi:hypothetical protein